MSDAPRVVVIGGGLGGLCLAEGLHRTGIPVTVHERDANPAVRGQGYRIHLGDVGATALADCLPPASYRLLLATAGRPGGRVTVATKRLRRLRVLPGDPAGVNVPVNRLTVREIMLADLGDVVRFGAEFTHYEPDGTGVRAHFADGDSVFADVLVGADGIGSRVRGQLLPHAKVIDTGNRVVYGKTLLDDTATRALLPADVRRGFLAVRAIPRPIGMALGLVEFAEPVAEAAARTGVPLTPTDDYLMFALTAPSKCFPCPDTEMSTMDGEALRAVVLGMTRSWHPHLRELLARCVPEENFHLPIRVGAPVPVWPTGPVTLLGDAVHAMSPAGGSGANTALRDAALLAHQLTAAHGPQVGEYERQMLDHGFAAVRASR